MVQRSARRKRPSFGSAGKGGTKKGRGSAILPLTSPTGVAGFQTSLCVAVEKTSGKHVGLEHSHQQFPFLDLCLRRVTVALDVVEQSPDAADFGGL